MQNTDIAGFIGEMIVVPPGATLAVLVDPIGGQGGQLLKYESGGSASIFQAPWGPSFGNGASTWAGASLVALNTAGGYLMSAGEAINYDGAARYYIMAIGATAILRSLRGLTPGF